MIHKAKKKKQKQKVWMALSPVNRRQKQKPLTVALNRIVGFYS